MPKGPTSLTERSFDVLQRVRHRGAAMPQGKTEVPAAPVLTDGSQLERLIEVVEEDADQIEVLDEIREQFQWAVRNAERFRCPASVVHLTSMPADPLAPDFGKRINRFSAKDLPAEPPVAAPHAPPPKEPPGQRELWNT